MRSRDREYKLSEPDWHQRSTYHKDGEPSSPLDESVPLADQTGIKIGKMIESMRLENDLARTDQGRIFARSSPVLPSRVMKPLAQPSLP